MLNVTKTRILTIASLAAAFVAFGQLKPDTAIEGFRVPLFDEVGFRIWQLRGDLATYQSETQIKINGMHVSQFTNNQTNAEIAKLTSPEATFHFDNTSAYGPGQLKVETNSFTVTGKDWIWLGKKKQITFNKDVKVVLYEGIGDILK